MAAISVRGREWAEPAVPTPPPQDVSPLLGSISPAAKSALWPIIAKRCASRDQNAIEAWLDPKLKHSMPDPHALLDMEKAAARLVEAIGRSERIGIWSDYDCDGATSAAIFGRFLRLIGVEAFDLHIPDRFRDGYGPNTAGLLRMREEGCGVVFILDAGIVAFEPLAAASATGLDIVVLDHHMAENDLPAAWAVVDPNRKDQPPGLGHLCAAGVTFLFCVEVCRQMGRANPGWKRPDLMPLLGLAALGTVADVVPLTGFNRSIVATGLRSLSQRQIPGIAALCEVAAIGDKAITARDCGFVFGPRINAGGRLADSTLGARCLLTDDPEEARRLAGELHALNSERQALEKSATEEAMMDPSLAERGSRDPVVIVGTGHEGVVGISAARLKEAFDAPAIVLTRTEEGHLKGSARSVPGFDIGHAIIEARKNGLIVKGGGHGMAGGLTLTPAQLPAFRAFLKEEVAASEYARTGVITPVDLAISAGEVDEDFFRGLERLQPFGTANPPPLIRISGTVTQRFVMKEKHLKLKLQAGNTDVSLLRWNCVGTPMGVALEAMVGREVEVIGEIELNTFNGRVSLQMMVEDIRTT